MPRSASMPQPLPDHGKEQTGAALTLAKARILLAAYCPPMPARGEVINNISELIEAITPAGGRPPRLVFRPAPTPAKRNGHNPAGME